MRASFAIILPGRFYRWRTHRGYSYYNILLRLVTALKSIVSLFYPEELLEGELWPPWRVPHGHIGQLLERSLSRASP